MKMAKTQKRSVSKGTGARTVSTRTAAAAPEINAVVERATAAAARSSYQEFKPDYTAVISDLKKIGILAVSFISVLVVISFFLR
jgi:hypothetical protein